MKKIIILLMAASLIAGGLGGYVYAATNHEPINGNKLVGFAPYGTSGDELQEFDAIFGWTNPDCSSNITIEQISIIRGDGTPVYEDNNPTTLGPHQLNIIQLSSITMDPAHSPNTVRFYTLEISWSAKGKCSPLVGTVAVFQHSKSSSTDTNPELSKTRTNMINR
ncbi:hypothetical protein ACFLX4_03055 [Chloroflexota bacterium]